MATREHMQRMLAHLDNTKRVDACGLEPDVFVDACVALAHRFHPGQEVRGVTHEELLRLAAWAKHATNQQPRQAKNQQTFLLIPTAYSPHDAVEECNITTLQEEHPIQLIDASTKREAFDLFLADRADSVAKLGTAACGILAYETMPCEVSVFTVRIGSIQLSVDEETPYLKHNDLVVTILDKEDVFTVET